jgi:MFS superfamily sulfate permease-like transporter
LSSFDLNEQGEKTSAAVLFGICIVLMYIVLKWMSKYPISYWGLYCINGMLSLMSIAILLTIFVIITGKTSFHKNVGTIMMIVTVIPSILFWWNFNIIEALRKQSNGKRRKLKR